VTPQDLQALRAANPPREERVDVGSVIIDMNAPIDVRAQQFLAQIKNPYAFMSGDVAVNIEFAPEGRTLREAMISYLKAQKK